MIIISLLNRRAVITIFNFKRKYYNTTYHYNKWDLLVNKFVAKYSYFQSKYDNNILYSSYTLQLPITNKNTLSFKLYLPKEVKVINSTHSL